MRLWVYFRAKVSGLGLRIWGSGLRVVANVLAKHASFGTYFFKWGFSQQMKRPGGHFGDKYF